MQERDNDFALVREDSEAYITGDEMNMLHAEWEAERRGGKV